MDLLILGGTRFLGAHLLQAARARGHRITVFHRGKHTVVEPEGVETILGDRCRDLGALAGRTWDAVIDTCGYVPRTVRPVVEALVDAVEHYTFISSVSVYAEFKTLGHAETAPLATLTEEQLERAEAIDTSGPVEAITYGSLYGGAKALCERVVEDGMPGRALIVRPGLIVGPQDYTDRLTYWVHRVAAGGEVLAPGHPQKDVQFMDVRDLAEWVVGMIEQRKIGTYNTTGPSATWTMEAVLTACRSASASRAVFTWVDDAFLLENKVAPWTEMPLWIPNSMPNSLGFVAIDSRRAYSDGLRYRALDETVADLLDWQKSRDPTEALRAGLAAERERELLQAWHGGQSP